MSVSQAGSSATCACLLQEDGWSVLQAGLRGVFSGDALNGVVVEGVACKVSVQAGQSQDTFSFQVSALTTCSDAVVVSRRDVGSIEGSMHLR